MERQGPASYHSNNVMAVVTLLTDNGYTFCMPKSPAEYSRMRNGNSLIVLYNNGTVLLQGADTESPRTLLDAFQPSQAQIELPF